MKALTSTQHTELELIRDLLNNWALQSSNAIKRTYWEEQTVMKICDFVTMHKDKLF
jgi:hypothetical protein